MKKLILMLLAISLVGVTVMYAASIEVTWTANTETDLAGYNVYDNGTLVGTVGVLASPAFTIPNVTDGIHSITLDAFDNATPSNVSVKSTPVVIAVDLTAPAKAAKPAAVVTGNSVKLTWVANAETDLAGYNVYMNGSLIGNTAGLTYTVSSLANGTYSFTIAAVDKSDNVSIVSDATVVKIDTTSPSAPTGIKAILKK